eukprot:UN13821
MILWKKVHVTTPFSDCFCPFSPLTFFCPVLYIFFLNLNQRILLCSSAHVFKFVH